MSGIHDFLDPLMDTLEKLSGLEPYEARKVADDRWEEEGREVRLSTVKCSGYKQYETCFFNPFYRVIGITLGAYDTKEEAEAGHAHWLEIVKAKPEQLQMVCNCDPATKIEESRSHLPYYRIPSGNISHSVWLSSGGGGDK